MRVLVVGFNFSAIGGLEIVSKAIAAVLARRGHAVRCAAVHETGRQSLDGYEIIGLAPAWAGWRSLSNRFPALKFGSRLRRLIHESDAVIAAHAHVLRDVVRFAQTSPCPPAVLCWLHGREVWGSLGRRVAADLGRADQLVAVSNYTAAKVHDLVPDRAEPFVIHNPVDTDVFVPAASPTEIRRHHLLTVGRHDIDSRHKGYDVLIEAMRLLEKHRPDLQVHLTITGSGPLLEQHSQQILRAGQQSRITLAGRVSRDALRTLYKTSDIFVFPSRIEAVGDELFGEGFGVVNAEAAACGRPVITSTDGGCPETVVEGVTGFTVDPRSPADVATAVARLLDLPAEERDAIGRRGREMAIKRFSTATFESAVSSFVESAAAKHTAHRASAQNIKAVSR